MTKRVSRRESLRGIGSLTATAAAARWFPAAAVLADAGRGRKLNVAAIGCGGRGLYMSGLNSELNYVALAEPDQGNLARALKNLAAGARQAHVEGFDPTRIKTFGDYRAMYDKIHKEIDLVLIATPDHQHACPSMMAIKLGKHVYCEKPLVHHIAERGHWATRPGRPRSPRKWAIKARAPAGTRHWPSGWRPAPSASCGKCMPGTSSRIALAAACQPPSRSPSPKDSTGTPGLAPPESGRSARSIVRGTAGATLARARWAAGALT